MLIELHVSTHAQAELADITAQVQDAVRAGAMVNGVCHVFVPHTTAGVTLNENWDPAVREDVVRALERIVPSVDPYRHGEGNSPAHIKALLVGSSATIPVEHAQLVLGRWQGIYLAEFDGPRQRRVLVTLIASE